MKRLLIAAVLAALLLSACGSGAPAPTEEPTVGLPNPIHETDEAGLAKATGISLPAPEYAEDVSWSYIEPNGEPPIAQMSFTLDGKKALLRAQATGKTALEDLPDISGLNYKWTTTGEQEEAVVGRRAMVFTNGEAGYVTWLDVVPGIHYCLGMSEGASVTELYALADRVFVPLQGNA